MGLIDFFKAANSDKEPTVIVKTPEGCDKIEYKVVDGTIVSGDYYSNQIARAGYFDGFCEGTTYHLFIPPVVKNRGVMGNTSQKDIEEMRTGKFVIASVGECCDGRKAVELIFEDEGDSPFSVTVPWTQTQPFFDESFDAQRGLTFKAYGGPGVHVAVELPMKLRFVDTLPCIRPWDPRIDEIPDPVARNIARNCKRPLTIHHIGY